MSPRNHAACVGNYCDAILIIAARSLLAQFGLTPKSKRGLAAREAVGRVSEEVTSAASAWSGICCRLRNHVLCVIRGRWIQFALYQLPGLSRQMHHQTDSE